MVDRHTKMLIRQAAIKQWELEHPECVKHYKYPSMPSAPSAAVSSVCQEDLTCEARPEVPSDAIAKKNGRHAAVKKWERKNPERVKQYKRTSMLRQAERNKHLPNVKTLLRHQCTPEQIASLVQQFTERHAIVES